MIVTILGGSSPSTPWLAEWLARECPNVPFTLRLAGRSQRKLAAVARACELLAAGSALRIEHFSKAEWSAALCGANLVLIQIRVGGLAARELDETLPPQFGVPGDEGLGPGGLSAAIRTWPILRELLGQIRDHAPAAIPLLLTSPAGILVNAAAAEFPSLGLTAICELPFTTLAHLARLLNRQVEDVPFSYCGLNHLGWLYDPSGELVEAFSANTQSPLAEVARRYGAVPLRYLALYFERERVACAQRRAGPQNCRARQLMSIAEQSFSAFESADAARIRTAMASRPAPWYTEAIGPLLGNLAGWSHQRPFFVTTGIEERAVALSHGVFTELPAAEPPRRVRELVDSFLAYERRAGSAMANPTEYALADALAAHPWVQRRDQARGLSAAILTAAERRTAALA